jgi:hypothetical protein
MFNVCPNCGADRADKPLCPKECMRYVRTAAFDMSLSAGHYYEASEMDMPEHPPSNKLRDCHQIATRSSLAVND